MNALLRSDNGGASINFVKGLKVTSLNKARCFPSAYPRSSSPRESLAAKILNRFLLFFSVERDRLRERERQARAQMSSQADHREMVEVGPLFDAPVRVSYGAVGATTEAKPFRAY